MITIFWANLIQDLVYGRVATPTIPATYHLSVSTTTPTVSGTGFTEPSAASAFARVPIINDKIRFTTSSNGTVTNNIELNFNESTANWGTITHAGLFDSATGGNLLDFGQLQISRTVESGTVLVVRLNQLQITLGNP